MPLYLRERLERQGEHLRGPQWATRRIEQIALNEELEILRHRDASASAAAFALPRVLGETSAFM